MASALEPGLADSPPPTITPAIATAAAVVVDASESMADPVDEAQPRRVDRAKEILASPLLECATATAAGIVWSRGWMRV